MSALTSNNFKSTTIKGTLQVSDHPTDETKLANAIFDRDITVGGTIINTNLTYILNTFIKWISFPSLTYQSGQGLKISWNKTGGAGETNFINYQDQGGETAFTFWNTSPYLIPTLVLTILNSGYILVNGINNTSATALEYIKNLTSDVQTQINTMITNITNNTTNITSNTANITTNTTNIASNTTDITNNTTNITSNTTNISSNTNNIASNTNNIASNTSNI
jgi:hypothetical protein